jgi:hypothetical protein
LGRSEEAIETIYEAAYSGRRLKKSLAGMKFGQDNSFQRQPLQKRNWEFLLATVPSSHRSVAKCDMGCLAPLSQMTNADIDRAVRHDLACLEQQWAKNEIIQNRNSK